MSENIYDQLINIALDTKDYEWAKQLQHEKVYGKTENKNMSDEKYLTFKFDGLSNYESGSQLKFTLNNNTTDELIQLSNLFRKQVEVTIKKEDKDLSIKGKLEDINIKYGYIELEVNEREQLNGVFDFLYKEIKVKIKNIN